MAGLDPAIFRGTVLDEMAGSGPAMTSLQILATGGHSKLARMGLGPASTTYPAPIAVDSLGGFFNVCKITQ